MPVPKTVTLSHGGITIMYVEEMLCTWTLGMRMKSGKVCSILEYTFPKCVLCNFSSLIHLLQTKVYC